MRWEYTESRISSYPVQVPQDSERVSVESNNLAMSPSVNQRRRASLDFAIVRKRWIKCTEASGSSGQLWGWQFWWQNAKNVSDSGARHLSRDYMTEESKEQKGTYERRMSRRTIRMNISRAWSPSVCSIYMDILALIWAELWKLDFMLSDLLVVYTVYLVES